MTILSYYEDTLAPTIIVLLIGGVAWLAATKASAQTRQIICGATLLTLLLVGMVPLVPRAARPTLPAPVMRPFAPVTTISAEIQAAERCAPTIQSAPNAPRPIELLPILALGSAAMSLLLALRLAGSLLAVARLRKRARPVSDRVGHLTDRPVRVVESLSSPVALGGFKPVILLPAEAEDWPEDRLRAVLIHEEAHLSNGDPNWQVLAELACLLHWFNPLAWFIRGAMRRDAERAADDAVLRAGVQPSAYAVELVAFAKKMGRDRQPVAWTAFARQSGMSKRVKAILTPHIERKPMTKNTKYTAIATVLVAAYVVSAFAFQTGKVANPTSPYKDIREGKTAPATRKNGFIGELSDGRKVEVLQISRRMPSGQIVAWKPDGSPMPASEQVKYSYRNPMSSLDTHTRYVFIRFPERKDRSVEPNAGCGSGPVTPGEPREMVFAGGGIIKHENGYYTIVSFIGIPKEDGDILSIGFGLTDSAWTELGKLGDALPNVGNVKITQVDHMQKADNSAEWEQKMGGGPLTEVDFEIGSGSSDPVGDLLIDPVFADPTTKRNENREKGNFGRYDWRSIPGLPGPDKLVLVQRRYFAYPMSAIKEFRLKTRDSYNCELIGLAAKPLNP